jgi:hypothetical protein
VRWRDLDYAPLLLSWDTHARTTFGLNRHCPRGCLIETNFMLHGLGLGAWSLGRVRTQCFAVRRIQQSDTLPARPPFRCKGFEMKDVIDDDREVRTAQTVGQDDRANYFTFSEA